MRPPRRREHRDIPRMVGMSEIAELAGGANPSAVSNWRTRYRDFPHPVEELKCGDIFLRSEAIDFLRAHPLLGKKQFTKNRPAPADTQPDD